MINICSVHKKEALETSGSELFFLQVFYWNFCVDINIMSGIQKQITYKFMIVLQFSDAQIVESMLNFRFDL